MRSCTCRRRVDAGADYARFESYTITTYSRNFELHFGFWFYESPHEQKSQIISLLSRDRIAFASPKYWKQEQAAREAATMCPSPCKSNVPPLQVDP